MSDPVLIESIDRLEVRSPMPIGLRIVLMLLALFPLFAPYELLVRVDWQDYTHPLFVLAAFISAGAAALSLLFLFAAVGGISSRLVFDRTASTLTYSFEAPVVRRTTRVYPLSAIGSIAVEERTWSDGAPTYHLCVALEDGTAIESGSSWSRDELEAIRVRVERYRAGASRSP